MKTQTKWVLNHQLLEGNVVEKFLNVQEFRKLDDRWEKEFRKLSEVQPVPVDINDIMINVGDAWMGDLTSTLYKEFCLFYFGIEMDFKYIFKGNIGIWDIKPCTSKFDGKENVFIETFQLEYGRTVASQTYYALQKNPKQGLFTMLFYGKQAVGKYAPDSSRPRFLVEADILTQKLRSRQAIFIEQFDAFCKENYGYELQKLYNDKVNGIRNRSWVGTGSHLQYLLGRIGMSEEWQKRIKARPYQLDAIWRLISDEYNILLGHEVGLGKTAISCAALMYRIKMGLTKKAMIVVQKSTLLQFSQTFQQMFPLARLLVMDTERINVHNRQRFLAEASLNCYDAILITHEAFKTIELSPAALEHYLEDMIEEMGNLVESSCKYKDGKPAKNGQTQFYKNCLSIYENYQKIIKNAQDKIHEPGTIFFDQMGIDLLVYDEAQKIKNGLFISLLDEFSEHSPSNFSNSSSAIAADFFFKTEVLKQQTGKQCLWLLTGTPEPTNSPKGVYFILRVLIPELLQEFGVLSFDSFITHFIMFTEDFEFKPDGSIQITKRMTGVKNYKSLARLLAACYDIKRYDDVKSYFPNGFRPEYEFVRLECELSEYQLDYMDRLRSRYELWKQPFEKNHRYPLRDKEGYLMWQGMTFVDIGMSDRRNKYDKPPEKYRQYLISPISGEKIRDIHDFEYALACSAVLAQIAENTKDDEEAGLLPKEEQDKYFNTVDSFFKIYGDAIKLMLDERLVESDDWHNYGISDPMPINPNGKIMTVAKYVADWYKKSAHKRTTCAIFLDIGAPNSAMKFSLYVDLKTIMTSLGIDSKEIVFIQDYKKDDQKLVLFDRINNGDVRVIIGHTESLGIGVNIQTRLELMILFDIVKTPDKHEQRIGRILRSGNTNPKVTIVQVLAKGKPGHSHGADAHAFGLLLRKISLREKVFSFNSADNVVETDPAQTEALFELLTAHATGNIKILEYKERKTKLDSLTRSLEAYESDLRKKTNSNKVKTDKPFSGSTEWLEQQLKWAIENYDARCQDLELMKSIDFDNFTINFGDQSFQFSKHKPKEDGQIELTAKTYTQTEAEFCAYCLQYEQSLMAKAWKTIDKRFTGKVGNFSNLFDIHVALTVGGTNANGDYYSEYREWYLYSPLSKKGYTFSLSITNTLKAIINKLKSIASIVEESKKVVDNWNKDISNTKKKIKDLEAKIDDLKSQIAALKPEVDRLGYEVGMSEAPPLPPPPQEYCPFVVLGLSDRASYAEVKEQYRSLISEYHPDRNPNDAIAEKKSKQINQAHDAIKRLMGI